MWDDYMELQVNGITIADTEAAAIALICKANGVECVVIKGISDFPNEVKGPEERDAVMAQYNTYVGNIPHIMNDIFDNNLEYAIKNHFDYL